MITKNELEEIYSRYLTDVVIKRFLSHIDGIYQRAIPKRLGKGGLIYDDNVNRLVALIKLELKEYSRVNYRELFIKRSDEDYPSKTKKNT